MLKLYFARAPPSLNGALVEYSADFYLVRDFMGKPIRLSISKVEDFQVISA